MQFAISRTGKLASIAALIVLSAGCSQDIAFDDTDRAAEIAARVEGEAPGDAARLRLASLIDAGYFPGAALAVGVDDDIVFSEAAGLADVAQGEPATPHTRFRIYSVSKTLTGMAAAALASDGLLDLDAPISVYLPDLAEPYASATARQLLGHVAGVPHYDSGEWMRVSQTHCAAALEVRQFFEADEPVGAPGERHVYSSFGYALLSAVLAAAAERSYEEVMNDFVFAPAGVDVARMDSPETPDARTALFYRMTTRGARVVFDIDNSCRAGAGGWVLSADEVARVALAFMEGRIASPQWRDVALTPIAPRVGESVYAFGVGVGEVERDAGPVLYAAHSGGAPGGRAAIVMLPDAGVVVVFAANAEGPRLVQEALAIAMSYYDAMPVGD